jgi:hypothetical protein
MIFLNFCSIVTRWYFHLAGGNTQRRFPPLGHELSRRSRRRRDSILQALRLSSFGRFVRLSRVESEALKSSLDAVGAVWEVVVTADFPCPATGLEQVSPEFDRL